MKFFLAPMGGLSKSPLRRLVLRSGAHLVWSEQVLASSLLAATRSLHSDSVLFSAPDGQVLLEVHPEEKPQLVIQIASASPPEAVKAVGLLSDLCHAIDINMDPPVPDPQGIGVGKQLLLDPSLAESVVSSVHEAYPTLPLFVKMRVQDTPEATRSFINKIANAGASRVVIHRRKLAATLSDHLIPDSELI